MAAFNRPTEATYEVHENITVDTSGKFFSPFLCQQKKEKEKKEIPILCVVLCFDCFSWRPLLTFFLLL